ncbi:MAG: hypothetical protein KatS3mg035_0836 [Bacteroidia bacterium]|nr:MAG: hypothetical protein KatS3mg035_0836 [Bacteroidia bacterium]
MKTNKNKTFQFLMILCLFFFSRLQAQCYLPYIEYNLWGLLDDSLHEVLPPKYDYIKNYNQHFWVYRKGLKYGILDSALKELTPPNFSVIYFIDKQKYLVEEDQKYVVKYWKDTLSIFLEVDTIHQAFAQWVHVEVNTKQGIMNYQNEWKIPPIYDEILTNGKDIIVLEDNLYYFMDTTHKKRLSRGFEEARFFSENLAAVKEDELFGFIDEKGNWVTHKEFLNAQNFQEKLAPVERNHRWGFINAKNELAIPYMYDYVYPFEKGKAIVQFKGKWGVINPSGKILIPLEYDEICFFEHPLFLVRHKNLWGILNEKQEWIIKPEFVDFRKFHCGYWIMFYEDKTSVIVNEKGIKIWRNL